MKKEIILSSKEVAKFLRKPIRVYTYAERMPKVGELIHYRCWFNSIMTKHMRGNHRIYRTIMVRDWLVNHIRCTYNLRELKMWEYYVIARRNKWDYMTYLDEKALE